MSKKKRYWKLNRRIYKTEYDNYRSVNWCRTSYNPIFEAAASSLCKTIDYKKPKAITQMKVLICDLFQAHKIDSTMYLSFSQRANNYNAHSRYNPSNVSYRVINNITRKLHKNKYLEIVDGLNYVNFKCSAKIRATSKLIQHLEDFGADVTMLVVHKNSEIVVLRDDNGKDVEYTDTPQTIEMRRKLKLYNELIEKTHININTLGYTYRSSRLLKEGESIQIHIDYSKKTTRRIFNGSWELGGRFYGGFWANIPSELRQRILINNEHVAEPDYSGMHIHLLYAFEKIVLGDKEPYIIPKRNDHQKLRNVYKKLLLSSVNCEHDSICINVARREINEEKSECPEDYPEETPDLQKMLEELKEYHAPIRKHINKERGLQLMVWDSDIAEDIMYQMTLKGIPVLCIHDGFVCRQSDLHAVEAQMIDSYIKIVSMKSPYLIDHLSKESVKIKTDYNEYSESISIFKSFKTSLDIIRASVVLEIKPAMRLHESLKKMSPHIYSKDKLEANTKY